MNFYEKEMNKCITLARKAFGKASPNPMVGCVVSDCTGKVISTGYHKRYGDFHAERDALSKLKDAKGCTLVVNLEPCCHQGKTPPCTDIIIEKGISRVVFGMKDPNPLVCGKGIEKLKKAGIEVIGPVLEDKCKNLNEIFIKNTESSKIFVAIKTATTLDGKISTHSGDSKWITSEKARNYARKLRRYYDAILTSSSTVIADNPTMKHKTKIILDRGLKTDIGSNIYKQGKIYVFYDQKNKCHCEELKKSTSWQSASNSGNITYIPTPVKNNKLDVDFILKTLFNLGIMSVFVEAGGNLSGSLLSYADKIYHFVAPKILNDNSGKSCFDGAKVNKISDCTDLKTESVKFFGEDLLITYSKK